MTRHGLGGGETPRYELVLVRACALLLWADESMAAVERDALESLVDSVAADEAEREALLELARKEVSRHQVLEDVARLPVAQRLDLFDRCVEMARRDGTLGRRERRLLAALRRRCGVGFWSFQRLLLRHSVGYRARLLAAVGVLAVAIVAAILGIPWPASTAGPEEMAEHPPLMLVAEPDNPPTLTPPELYNAVRRSVVVVHVLVDGRPLAHGSGVVIGVDRERTSFYVITNRHVVDHEVRGGHKLAFETEFENGGRFSSELDFRSDRHDLALLRVLGTPLWAAAVALRPSDSLAVGETVYAVGAPLGLRYTLTAGIISALRGEFIQTDATVTSGSSGGPLFDVHGLLCGVVTTSHVAKDYSFAQVADTILDLLEERDAVATK